MKPSAHWIQLEQQTFFDVTELLMDVPYANYKTLKSDRRIRDPQSSKFARTAIRQRPFVKSYPPQAVQNLPVSEGDDTPTVITEADDVEPPNFSSEAFTRIAPGSWALSK